VETEKTQAGVMVGDRFVLEDVLGKGGHARVWRARDMASKHLVAVKLLHRSYRGHARITERFARELAALEALEHDTIVRPIAADLDAALPFIATELVEGVPLDRYLGQRAFDDQLIDLASVAELGRAVASGLDHAHDRGVLHRDLKPSNVILQPSGAPKILDFGVAKLLGEDASSATTLGRAVGSLAYMSREQIRGEPVDQRTDVYALAVILFEVIALRRAWHRDADGRPVRTYVEALRSSDPNWRQRLATRICTEPRPKMHEIQPALGREACELVDGVLQQAMATDPAERPSTATELAEMLAAAVDQAPVQPVTMTGLRLPTPSPNQGIGPKGTPIRALGSSGAPIDDGGPRGTPIRELGPNGAPSGEGEPSGTPIRELGPRSPPVSSGEPAEALMHAPSGARVLTPEAPLAPAPKPEPSTATGLSRALTGLALVLGVGALALAVLPDDPEPSPATVAPNLVATPGGSPPSATTLRTAPAAPATTDRLPNTAATDRAQADRAKAPPAKADRAKADRAKANAAKADQAETGLRALLGRARSEPTNPRRLIELGDAILARTDAIADERERQRVRTLTETSAALGDIDGLAAAVAAVEGE